MVGAEQMCQIKKCPELICNIWCILTEGEFTNYTLIPDCTPYQIKSYVKFSRDSIRAFNDQLKIRENIRLCTVYTRSAK